MFTRGFLSNGRLLWTGTTHLNLQTPGLVKANLQPNRVVPSRNSNGDLLPKTQYDIPISEKFIMPDVLVKYWELSPIFVTTGISLFILLIAVAWAVFNKVDVSFSHGRDNISRTMNLHTPTAHKMMLINQRYDPWPEMQCILEEMKFAEKRIASRARKCSPSP